MALATAIGLAACAEVEPPPIRTPSEPSIAVAVCLDWGFSAEQKLAIEDAASRLTAQSRGWLTVDVLGDISPDFHVPTGAWRVLATPSDTEFVAALDRRLRVPVLGWANDTTMDIHLVADRLDRPSAFLHVAMHELAHAAGAQHLPDPGALMWRFTAPESPTTLQVADEVEIYRVAKKANQ